MQKIKEQVGKYEMEHDSRTSAELQESVQEFKELIVSGSIPLSRKLAGLFEEKQPSRS